MTKPINDIFNMHKFINDQVYNFLAPYKKPNQCFQIEESVTRHVLNAFINKTDKNRIKHFSRISPEVMTGSDFLLIFRGTYQGKKREFKILYQAKLTFWKHDEPCIHLDLKNKKVRLIPLSGKSYLHLSDTIAIDILNYLIIKGHLPKSQLQHESQINFGKLIKAETLYICYRHRIDKNKEKKKSVGFINTKHLEKHYTKTSQASIPEHSLGKKFYFYNSIDSFLKKYIKKVMSSEEGFFFWMSNFELFYNSYTQWIALQNQALNADEKDYELQPIELTEEGSFLQMIAVDNDQELQQFKPIYSHEGNSYLLKIPQQEDKAIFFDSFFPQDILIIDLE